MIKQFKRSEIFKVFLALVGTVCYALGVNLFIVPHGLYTGGLLGLCQIIRTALVDSFGIPVGNVDLAGILFFILNIPILLLAYKSLGRKFFLKTIMVVVVMTVLLSLIVAPSVPYIGDMLTSCIIGGIISGAGTGMILMATASGGGLDVLSMYFTKKYKKLSFGKVTLIFNAFIYLLCFLNFTVEVVVYSVIYSVFYSLIVDKVHQQNISVKVLIFTKQRTEPIEEYVIHELGRGVTYWDGRGAFTDEQMKIICVCLSKYEVDDLKRRVLSYDYNAFIIVEEGVKVDGNFLKKL